ncbi:unnamed protein product [Phytomonas sp. Hart1]|nr:unnamed protein product [Phytomonas sp. Hart1]|eukprot:CCW66482.1 unnamed protein product [Phytomonas sp. isolate Hart1]
MLSNSKTPLSPRSGSLFKEKRLLIWYTLIILFLGGAFRFFYKNYWSPEKSNKLVRFNSGEPSPKKLHKRHDSSSSKHRKRHSKSLKINHTLPSVILLLGIHSSGKTEWSTQYIERVCTTAILIRSDDIRKNLTGSVQDHTKEDEVERLMLMELEKNIQLKQTIVIDDCEHNLCPEFRRKIIDLVPSDKFNLVVRCFLLKPIFARERIIKDSKEGKKLYVATDLELEGLALQFDETQEDLKNEGLIEIKD